MTPSCLSLFCKSVVIFFCFVASLVLSHRGTPRRALLEANRRRRPILKHRAHPFVRSGLARGAYSTREGEGLLFCFFSKSTRSYLLSIAFLFFFCFFRLPNLPPLDRGATARFARGDAHDRKGAV